jgi:O-antigen ligase
MQSANLVGSILTVRSAIFLPLLAVWVASRLDAGALARVAHWFVPLVVVNAMLGSVQFYSSPQSIINKYANEAKFISTATYSQNIRATGTFSYITGFGIFGAVGVAFGLVILACAKTSQARTIGYATIVGGTICAAATVSRASLLGCIVIFLAWAVLSGRASRVLIGIAVFAAAFYVVAEYTGKLKSTTEILSAAQKRHAAVNDPVLKRVIAPLQEMLGALDSSPFGDGLGTEQVGGNYYVSGRATFTTFEYDWARIIMEIGVAGFLGVLITYLGALAVLFDYWRTAVDPKLKGMLIAVVLLNGFLFYTGVIFNHVASFYFWALVALAMALLRQPAARERPTASAFVY